MAAEDEFYETDLGVSRQALEAHIVAHTQPWLEAIAGFYKSERARHHILHAMGLHDGEVHEDAVRGETHAWSLLERGLQSLWN